MDTLVLTPKATTTMGSTRRHERQRFINRMQRKLGAKEALYSDGLEHRFTDSAQIGFQENTHLA